MKNSLCVALAVALLLGVAGSAHAQTWPNRPLRFIIPFPPGGGLDRTARTIHPKLQELLGQPLVIENKAGAAGVVGAEFAKNQPPDGYTLFLGNTGTMGLYPALYQKLPYDALKEFAPVGQLISNTLVAVTGAQVPANTLAEFIAWAKANPGRVSYASGGSGAITHLAGEMLKAQTGIDMLHVPYKGSAPAVTDLLGGQVHLSIDVAAVSQQHVKAGKLKALAVTSSRRNAAFPELPTFDEAGVKGYQAIGWPGLLMGAISMDLPAIFFPAGPMLNGHWRGERTGAGTHTKKVWEELRAGNITQADWVEPEGRMTRSHGTCNTMGTASTMTSIAEALGFTLPGATSIPAVDSAHARMAIACGERSVAMVLEDLKPSRMLTPASFQNALVVYMALGGSTNAAVHLPALAGRAGILLTLADMDAVSSATPVLANLYPSGKFLMEDFFFAGGLPALMQKVASRLALDCLTVNGKAIGQARCLDDDIIRDLGEPIGELAARRAAWKPPAQRYQRSYALLYQHHVSQTDRGCDFDFLEGRGAPEPPIF